LATEQALITDLRPDYKILVTVGAGHKDTGEARANMAKAKQGSKTRCMESGSGEEQPRKPVKK